MKTKISRFPALGIAAVAMLAMLNVQSSTPFAQGRRLPPGARPGRKLIRFLAAAISLMLALGNSTNAAPLQYNGNYLGGRLIYDPNTGLTWYQAPYNNVTWYVAMAWAANLNIGGVTGWRLPVIAPATVIDGGIQMIVTGNPNDGEMGHLWYDELGNHAGAMTNSGPFDATTWQWPYNTGYWSNSGPWYGHASTFAVYFDFGGGNYGLDVIQGSGALCAEIAVYDGDVGPNGLISTNGVPTLFIAHSGNTVTVYWQAVSGWSLQQNGNLAATNGWSASSGVTTLNGTNYLNVVNPTGNLFYRLAK